MNISLFRTGRWVITGLTAMVVVYSISYLSKSYQEILLWYGGDTQEFFRKDDWKTNMFSEDVKKAGNVLCISLSTLLLILLTYFWRVKPEKADVKIVSRYSLQDIIIVIITFLFWWYYQKLTPYAYDEVFSAYHFASHSAWLSLSYYPLPNNHVFYNLLNAFAGQMAGDHFLITGRVLSFLAYGITSLLIYRIVNQVIKNEWLALLSCILVISQFPVLGFATQARGYSLLIMCTLIAVNALWKKKDSSFYWWDVAVVTGMAVMPSFLYFWFGLGLSGFYLFKDDKSNLLSFLKHNFISALIVLVFYLPLLSISGYKSLVANKYVTSTSTGFLDFFQSFSESHYLKGLFNEWFYTGAHTMIGCGLIFLWVFAAFLIKDQDIRRWNILTAGCLLGTIFIISISQKLPFYRNLAPISIVLWMAMIMTFISHFSKFRFSKRQINYSFAFGILIIFAHYQLHHTLPDQLYYYDVKNTYEKHQLCLSKNSLNQRTVTLHEDAFYWYGFLPNHKINKQTNHKIMSGMYIVPVESALPLSDTLIWECERYRCYQISEK